MPKRSVTVSCPIHPDDGTTAVFEGYRVQHLTLGPTKGGTRFGPTVDLGEVAALAIWMSWNCALVGLPYGCAKGGINVDASSLSNRELQTLSRGYMLEMISFVGPHTDVIAPDLGTNEQIMSWFMDIYSMYQGQTVTEIVFGKPVSAGGTLGRREATGWGAAHLVCRAADELKIPLNGAKSCCSRLWKCRFDNRIRATQHGSESDRGQRSHGRALSTSGARYTTAGRTCWLAR